MMFALPILAGLGWWYFRQRELTSFDPAYREYAYITNGKSNSVSVIDLRTFLSVKTLRVGMDPTGVAANSKKNEVYVVNSGSAKLSVIDAEHHSVLATICVAGQTYFIYVSARGKPRYV